ncbi:MAG: hypothetical protein E6G44_00720, partial [Actinobacteria bacterium]
MAPGHLVDRPGRDGGPPERANLGRLRRPSLALQPPGQLVPRGDERPRRQLEQPVRLLLERIPPPALRRHVAILPHPPRTARAGKGSTLLAMRALRGQARRAPTVLMTVLEAVLVAAAYYLSARLALRLALIEKNVTPLWPPTGIAVVGFLLLGRRIWPGIALAAFLVNVPITPTPWVALATAAGNTLAPFVAAELLRLVGFRREIDRLRDAIAIVLLASLLAMLISATIGAAALRLSHGIRSDDFAAAWAVWWTGDAMGVLVVAPFLLSLLLFRPRVPTSWARRVEAVALFVALTALTLAVARNHHPILFVVLPLLGWAAWRFQQRGAAPAALLVAGIVTWAADHDWGPFAHTTLFAKMLTLQAFNATVAFASFVFAALVMERIRAREALETAAAELEERVRRRTAELSTANRWLTREITDRRDAEHRLHLRERQLAEAQQLAHIGSWDWLIDDDRVTWSDEMYRIYGHEPQQFPVTFERAVEQVLP